MLHTTWFALLSVTISVDSYSPCLRNDPVHVFISAPNFSMPSCLDTEGCEIGQLTSLRIKILDETVNSKFVDMLI